MMLVIVFKQIYLGVMIKTDPFYRNNRRSRETASWQLAQSILRNFIVHIVGLEGKRGLHLKFGIKICQIVF